MKIRPLRDIVYIIPDSHDTAGGLVLTGKQDIFSGIVAAVGPGIHMTIAGKQAFKPTTVESGMRVHYEWNAGNRVTVDGQEYIYMREENLAAHVLDGAHIGHTSRGNGGEDI